MDWKYTHVWIIRDSKYTVQCRENRWSTEPLPIKKSGTLFCYLCQCSLQLLSSDARDPRYRCCTECNVHEWIESLSCRCFICSSGNCTIDSWIWGLGLGWKLLSRSRRRLGKSGSLSALCKTRRLILNGLRVRGLLRRPRWRRVSTASRESLY